MAQWDQFGKDYDHPPFEGTPRLYLIASTPRSGSHFLGHQLLQTGALGSPLEYFHKPHLERWAAEFGTPDFPSTMARLYARRTSPSGWFGAKAHWTQFIPIAQRPQLLSFLGIKTYIEIVRRDRIAQAISFVIAQQTQAWISFHDRKGEPRYDFGAIRRVAEALDKDIASWRHFFASQGITPLTVEYETLTSDPTAIVDRILQHCGTERTQAAPRWQPQRQASEINVRWHDRYHADLAAIGAEA